MITTAMAAVIGADRTRVWRALTDPNELVVWDDELLGLVDAKGGYPVPGSAVRWRVRLGSVQTVMRDRTVAVDPGERLESELALGSMHMLRTWSLQEHSEAGANARTRLTLKLAADNTVPVIGSEIDRFEVRRLTTERVDGALRALRSWCEGPAPGSERTGH